MPPCLPEGVRSLDDHIKDPAFHLDLIVFEVQGDTMFPHEHGAEDDIISVDVDDIEVMVILHFTDFEVSKDTEVYLRTAANCSQLQGHGFFQLVRF